MNNRFLSPHQHTSPNCYQTFQPSFGSPFSLPPAAAPQQGDFGYSAPRRYRSSHLYPIPELSSCCPPQGQIYPSHGQYPRGFPGQYTGHHPGQFPGQYPRQSPHSAFKPFVESEVREHTPNFVRKDSYWSSLPAVSYTGVRQQVARRFVDYRQSRRKAQRLGFRRPFTMSSSTALLPKDRKKHSDDHPIFLRVCHSPWIAIGQKALIILRGITALYLLISFIMIIDYEINVIHHKWLTVFELSNIVYFLQTLYAWISLVWTWMHLHYPHHGNQIPTGSTRLQSLFSPPRQNPSTKNRAFFSIYYTAAVTFPFVVTFIHWAILSPKHETYIPVDKIFHSGWFTGFFVVNKNIINSVIALIEIFVYSSIRRQDPFGVHVLGLSILALLYAGWAYAGHCITGQYDYYFFDHHKFGWAKVAEAVVGFILLTNIWFAFVYGLTGIREKLTKRSEDKSYGYARLPQ